MFGWKAKQAHVKAQAEILDEGTLVGKMENVPGSGGPDRFGDFSVSRLYGTFDYQVELRSPDRPAQRVVATGRACAECKPVPGDVIDVDFDPKHGTATFELAGDERFDPVVLAKQVNDSWGAELELVQHLETTGVRCVATVVAVRPGRLRYASRVAHADVRVEPGSGDAFDATIVTPFSHDDPELPEVGQQRRVKFDPADRSRITWWDEAGAMRWRVPATCPQCGAPVDQSTASLAEHPTCTFCHAPLPCEPA